MKKLISIAFILALLGLETSHAGFEEFIGKEIALRCKGTVQRAKGNTFLDGNTRNGRIYLSSRTDTDESTGTQYTGTHWRPKEDPTGGYGFECLGHLVSPQFKFLDGNTANGQVYLSPSMDTIGRTWYSGTHWQPHLLSDGSYAFECLGHLLNPNHKFLDGSGATVRLSANRDGLGTHWEVQLIEQRVPIPGPAPILGRFPTALELDEKELRRCITACQSTKSGRLVEAGLGYWTDPIVKTFGGRTGSREKVLDRFYTDFGIFIAQGPRVVIAFPGTDFLKPSDIFSDLFVRDWNIQRNSEARDDRLDMRFKRRGLDEFGGTSQDIPGRCHRGFLGVYKSTSGELRALVDQYWRDAQFSSAEALQITVTGHSLGGAVAQLASVDIVNHLYFNGDFERSLFNKNNNVTVVTFGSPPLFNKTAQELWDRNWGKDNHLRVFRENDFVPEIYKSLIGWRTVGRFAFGLGAYVGLYTQIAEQYDVFHTGVPRRFESGGRILVATHTLDGYAADFKKWKN